MSYDTSMTVVMMVLGAWSAGAAQSNSKVVSVMIIIWFGG